MSKQKVKILVIGDPHIKAKSMREGENLVNECIAIAKQTEPDAIIVLGDLLDTHEIVRVTPYKLACSFLEQLSEIAHTILIIGNHDLINASQFLTDNHPYIPFKRWSDITIVDIPIIIDIKGLKFITCPYVPPGRFEEALRTIDKYDIDTSQCIFAHQEFRGCRYNDMDSIQGDEWSIDRPPIISGHIHGEQKLSCGVYYPGAPTQHHYSDSPNRYIWLTTFTEGERKFNINKIQLSTRGKKEINITIDEFKSRIEEIKRETDRCDIRLVITGSQEQITAFRLTDTSRIKNIKMSYSITADVKQRREHENCTLTSVLKELVEKQGDINTKIIYNEWLSTE